LKSSSFHIDGNVEICELTEQISTSGTAIAGRQDVKPDPQRHQRRAESGKSGDESHRRARRQAGSRRWRRPLRSLVLDHCGDVYTTRRTGTIAIEAFNNNLMETAQ
jgi:hypothetical protein